MDITAIIGLPVHELILPLSAQHQGGHVEVERWLHDDQVIGSHDHVMDPTRGKWVAVPVSSGQERGRKEKRDSVHL